MNEGKKQYFFSSWPAQLGQKTKRGENGTE